VTVDLFVDAPHADAHAFVAVAAEYEEIGGHHDAFQSATGDGWFRSRLQVIDDHREVKVAIGSEVATGPRSERHDLNGVRDSTMRWTARRIFSSVTLVSSWKAVVAICWHPPWYLTIRYAACPAEDLI
jgi:hypothetical protein